MFSTKMSRILFPLVSEENNFIERFSSILGNIGALCIRRNVPD